MDTLFGWTFTDFGPNRLAVSSDPPRLTLLTALRPASLKARLRELCPRRPGVYGMLDRDGDLIYVGKAKSLRGRLLSYFRPRSRDARSTRIVRHTCGLVWEVNPSEFAALHRELELIRRWRPRFNVRGQPTGWSYSYVCLGRPPAPYAFLARRPPAQAVASFGPVLSGPRAAEAVRRLNDWFRLRDCSQQQAMVFADQGDLFPEPLSAGCLRYEIGTCLGPCAAFCNRDEYGRHVNAARAFLSGADRTPLETLQREMEAASAALAFERAAALRDRYEALLWLHQQLESLREARTHGSFVYPVTGFEGKTIWYLIHGGRTVGAILAPTDEERAERARQQLRAVYPAGAAKKTGEVIEALEGVMLVGSWFRQHPEERERVLTPDEALARCTASERMVASPR